MGDSSRKKEFHKLSLTKVDVVEQVFNSIGFSKKEADEFVDLTFDLLKELICKHKVVKISKFGTFRVKERKTKIGRNPITGQSLSIPARWSLYFKPSSVLKKLVNENNTNG